MKSRAKTFALILGFSLCFCHGAENLIRNGETSSGEASVPGLELTASGPHGVRCYAVPQARKLYMGQDFIEIDPNGEYEFSAEICGNGKDANRADIGLVMYDEKKGLIPHSTVDCIPGSEAVTAAPVDKGTKVMLLKNAGDWETFVKRGAKVIAMNAKKDHSDLPNRDLCCFIQKITRKGDLLEVTLSYGAGKAYPADTPVRLHRDGGYQWSLLEFQIVPSAWKKVSVRILGTAARGVPKNQFWKTTRYVKPVINSNMDSALFIRNLSLTKLERIPEGKVQAEFKLIPEPGATLITTPLSAWPRRQFAQKEDGSIVIEAENPWKFTPAHPNKSSVCFEAGCGGGRYLQHSKYAVYPLNVTKPGKFLVYYRQRMPFAAEWNHSFIMDGKVSRIIDCLPAEFEKYVTWNWHQAGKIELSAGEHTFSMDFQGGPMLDQIAFIPEQSAFVPRKNEILVPEYVKNELGGQAIYSGYLAGPNRSAAMLSYRMKGEGTLKVSVSFDGGKTWKDESPKASLPEFKKDTPMLVRISADSQDCRKIPLVEGLKVNCLVSTELPPEKSRLDKSMVSARDKIRLIPVKWTGARWGKDGKLDFSRPLVPDADGIIYARITDADNMILSPAERSWLEKDPQLDGATVLYQGRLNNNLVAFDFKLKKSGKYRPYFLMRLSLPSPGIVMDFNRPEIISLKYGYLIDQKAETITNVGTGCRYPYQAMYGRKYYWFPANPIDLASGEHVLRLRWGMYYMNCAAMALVPEENPRRELKPVMPNTSARERSGSAAVDYAEITGKLKKLQIPSEARFEISYDSGKTFSSLPVLPMTANRNFMLRGYFSGNGSIPEIQAEVVSSKFIALQDTDQKMTFDYTTGNLTGCLLTDGTAVLPEGTNQPLFSFQIGSAKTGYRMISPEPGTLTERSVRKGNGKEILELHYALCDKKVEAMVRVTLAKGTLPLWELSLSNQSGEDVRNIEFPSFRDIRLAGNPENVYYTIIHNLCGFGGTAAPLGTLNNTGVGTWPSDYSMGYSAIYARERGSFTLQNRNPDGIGVRFSMRPNAGNSAVSMSTSRRYLVEPGKKVDLQYAGGFFKGDEHAVCDLYGKWARSWMDFSLVNSPAAKNVGACAVDSAFYPLDRTENQLIPIFRWLGYDMHWVVDAVGYTHLFTSSYGSPDAVKAKCRALENAGQPIIQYWDHYGWSLLYETSPVLHGYPREKLPFHETLAKKGMAEKGGNRNEQGNLRPWNYVPPDCTMCTSNHTWNDYARFVMQDYLSGKFGFSGIYADETCMYVECYNTAHDHGKQYGMKMVGLGKLFTGILRDARKKGKTCFFDGEGSPDYLLQFEEFGLRSGTDAQDGAPLLFALPEVKFFRGQSNHPNDGIPNWDEAVRDYHLIARSDLPAYAGNARHFTQHRKRIGEWMYNGIFRDNVGLRLSQPGVVAKYFVRKDEDHYGILINFRNEHLKSGIQLELDKKLFPGAEIPPAALAFLMEEERTECVPVKKLSEAIRMTVPLGRAGSILIPFRMPEEESIRADILWPQCKGQDVLRLSLMNFGRKEQTVPLKLELPKGLSVRDLPETVSLNPGQYVSLDLPLMNRNSLQDQANAVLTAGSRKQLLLLAPDLSNRSFEQHTGKTMTADHWGVYPSYYIHAMKQTDDSKLDKSALGGILDGRDPYDGKYSLRLPGRSEPLPFPMTLAGPYGRGMGYPAKKVKLPWYYNAQQNAILKPGTRYRLTFAVRFSADDGLLKVQPFPYTERLGQVSLTFAPKECKPAKGDRKWNIIQLDFTTKNTIFNATQTPIAFVNLGPSELWIDAVSVEESNSK